MSAHDSHRSTWADISGYTGYLADVELDHAQDILADLIGAVVTALRPNFRHARCRSTLTRRTISWAGTGVAAPSAVR